MQRRRIWLTGFMVGFLALGCLVFYHYATEPSHAGLSVSFWFDHSSKSGSDDGEAAKAFKEMGGKALPFLRKKIRAQEPWWRTELRRHWNRLPNFARQRIKYPLSPEFERIQAVHVLKQMGDHSRAMIPELIAMLNDPQWKERAASLRYGGVRVPPEEWEKEDFELGGRDLLISFNACLWRTNLDSGTPAIFKQMNVPPSLDNSFKSLLFRLVLEFALDEDTTAFNTVLYALDDPDLQIVDTAMFALRTTHLRNRAESVLPRLIDILPTLPGSAQREMYGLFGFMTNRIDLVTPVLIGALGHDSRYWRQASFSLATLNHCQTSVATSVVAAFQKHQGPILGFVQCLAELGSPARDALPRLQKLIESENWDQRYACALAIWKIGNQPEALARLRLEELSSRDEQTIWNALVFFGQAGTRIAYVVPRVIELLSHPEQRLRGRAAITLGKIGVEGASAIPALEAVAQNDPYLNVREAAQQALKEIRSPATQAVEPRAE